MKSIYLENCKSTNDELFVLFNDNFDDFSSVYTFNQTQGRGVLGSIWQSEKNKNLAISFSVKQNNTLDDVFLSFFIACKLQEFFQKKINNKVFIKWPNDIIISDKKIVGILIEKRKKKSQFITIVGIGININQKDFNCLKTANSLSNITNIEYNLDDFSHELQQYLKINYQKIEYCSYYNYFNDLVKFYNKYLYKINQICVFKINNSIQNGIIQKVDKRGNLYVLLESEKIQIFKTKEIEMLINYDYKFKELGINLSNTT